MCFDNSVESFSVKGGGGSDDMFFNSLVNIVGVLCVPFFHFIGRKGICDLLDFTTGTILEEMK